MTDLLTAEQAAERLNIKPATLYSYVSRGFIRTQPDPADPRRRFYRTEDIERLAQRRTADLAPGEAAIPSLFEAVGQDAAKLASRETFERSAAVLWGMNAGRAESLFRQPLPPVAPESAGLPVLPALMTALAAESAYDVRAYDASTDGQAMTGARILRLMADVLAGGVGEGRIAERLAAAWRGDSRLFDAALILLADEEHPVTAGGRQVERAQRLTPYGVVLRGLALLGGSLQADQSAAAALLREVGLPGRAHAVVARRLQHGLGLPGFIPAPNDDPTGHRRTGALLDLMRSAYPDGVDIVESVIGAARYALSARPGVTFALAALEVAGRLPDGAGLGLLALGRSAAWLRP